MQLDNRGGASPDKLRVCFAQSLALGRLSRAWDLVVLLKDQELFSVLAKVRTEKEFLLLHGIDAYHVPLVLHMRPGSNDCSRLSSCHALLSTTGRPGDGDGAPEARGDRRPAPPVRTHASHVR